MRSLNVQYANDHGQALLKQLSVFNAAIDSGDIRLIDSLYDEFTNCIEVVEIAIGNVYGQSNRDSLLENYLTPSKIAKERVIYEVSQYRLLLEIEALLQQGSIAQAKEDMAKLDRLIRQADEIKAAGGYKACTSNDRC
jgi:hypothetical protein